MGPVAVAPIPAPIAGPIPGPAPAGDSRDYVVKRGDTLSSIASHELGASSKWPEIAKANEDTLHGSTNLKVGTKLKIPAAGASAGPSAPEGSAVASQDAPASAATAEHEYVVKSGDTLWAIAKSEMGSDKCVVQLKEANAGVLKGSDQLKVGMKLKIPAKK
jgi:nucleoid-associated protein YgaU